GGMGSFGLEEGIVGLHVVGDDDEVVSFCVTGQDRLGRLAEAASEAGLIAERADVASADGLEGEGLDDGVCEVGLAVLIEKPKELIGFVSEGDSAARHFGRTKPSLGTYAQRAVSP